MAYNTTKSTHLTKFGQTPQWDEEFEFNIVDEYTLNIELYVQIIQDHEDDRPDDVIKKGQMPDKLIGFGQISLLPIFERGYYSDWLPLKLEKPGGKSMRESGSLRVHIVFAAMSGISFPQHRLGVTTYDDKYRKRVDIASYRKQPIATTSPQSLSLTKPASVPSTARTEVADASRYDESQEQMESVASQQRTGAGTSVAPSTWDQQYDPSNTALIPTDEPPSTQEFTDDEIVAAFRFIDLDHNNFVGAKEIKHILICMGELVTDEEVDMMIQIVDTDGDGQVCIHLYV